MKSTIILDLMIRDHTRLLNCLKDVENNLKQDFDFLIQSFQSFQWNVEKHFFVEERAIFISYNPSNSNGDYNYFSDLMDQHTEILEIIKSLENKLQRKESFDLNKLKKLLLKHKTYEEKHIYSVIDQEIDDGEKRYIIDRINDVRL